jgi:predicted P-loop ATPase
LVDNTGNRRFWPIDAGKQPVTKSVFNDLDGEVDQLWAEAVVYWRLGEALYLTGELATVALAVQEQHRDTSTREGSVIRFLEKKVPSDWGTWPLERRRIFWGGGVVGEHELVERDRVSAVEVWVEAFGGDQKTITRAQKKEINFAIKSTGGWAEKVIWHTDYGPQRGFVRE